MTEKRPNNHLSIYRAKNPRLSDEEIIRDFELYEERNRIERYSIGYAKLTIGEAGTAYVKQVSDKTPRWQRDFFRDLIDVKVKTSGVAYVVRIVVDEEPETFIVTMGAQGRFIVDNDVLDDRFGIKAALCMVDSKKLKQIRKNEVTGSNRITYQQVSHNSGIENFDIDPFSDYLKSITGSFKESEFCKGMVKGSSALSFSARVDIHDIAEVLEEITRQYRSEAYKEEFEWIDNLYPINDKRTIERLDNLAIESANRSDGKVWFAIPEIVDMEKVRAFRYCGVEDSDIFLGTILEYCGTLTAEMLKSQVVAIDNTTDSPYAKWKLRNCLCGEVDLDGEVYGINSGSWFRIDKRYATQAEREYAAIGLYPLTMDAFDKTRDTKMRKTGTVVVSEGAYLERVASERSKDFVSMDQDLVKSQEVCDLVTKDALIHVKRYSTSSALSHMFFQGLNSASMLDTDEAFLNEANEKIARKNPNEEFLIKGTNKKKIVFAIISEEPGKRLHLPLFSKISLRHTMGRLRSLGYTGMLLAIPTKS